MKITSLALIIVLSFSFGYAQKDSVFTIVSGDSVTIWDTRAEENCASRFAFSIVMLDSNGIALTEIDTVGPAANCGCIYDLSTTLVGLATGRYSVNVFRQYLKLHFYPIDTIIHIGSAVFDINQSSSTTYAQSFHQSSCEKSLAVTERTQKAIDFSLDVNYPNPFNPITIIQYSIPYTTHVTLKVFDGIGREVITLVDERKNPGTYHVRFNSEGLAASGLYFCQLTTSDFRQTRKMLLIK